MTRRRSSVEWHVHQARRGGDVDGAFDSGPEILGLIGRPVTPMSRELAKSIADLPFVPMLFTALQPWSSAIHCASITS
jgi:hypothetical protein